MSTRQWLSSAVRQCQSGLARQQQQQQSRALSTSAPLAQFRSLFGDKNNTNNKTSTTTRDPSGPARPNRRARSNPTDALSGILEEGFSRGPPLSAEEQRQVMEQQHSPRSYVRDLRSSNLTDSYVRQMPRRWRTGDVYAPRDMSPAEMSKWRQGRRPDEDVVDKLGFSPLDNYRNFSLISEFITPMGNIKHSLETGLRPVNQRKVAKAIRRAIGMGLHPSVHKHPEILRLGRHGLPASAVPTPAAATQNRI